MTVYTVTEGEPTKDAIDAAAHALDGGSIVAIPTDTVYGLVADVSYTGAADRVFALKKRSRTEDLSILVADVAQALTVSTELPEKAEQLMNKFWPGPLALILPRDPEFIADLGDDDFTIGVRCPDNFVARLLCEEVGPIAVTTANVQGTQPAKTAQEVVEMFGKDVEVVLDGGPCTAPMATVVDFTGATPKLLREGAISWAEVQAVLA